MIDRSKQEPTREKSVFQPIVENISRTVNLPASIWVPDERRQILTIAASVGLPASYVREAFLDLDEPSVTGEAFKTGKVIRVSDAPADQRWKYKDIAHEMGWKSVLCVPIQVNETVIGVVSIYTFVVRGFSDLEIGLLTNYADQIRLTLEADRRRETFSRLLEAGHQIEQLITEQPRVVLEEIVRAACEVIGADCAVLYPYDPQREDFYDVDSVAAYGLSKPLQLSERPRRRTGMAAYVRREQEVVISDIEEEDPKMLDSPFIKREGIKAFMGIALQVAAEVLGILYVDFGVPHRFSDGEKDTIRLFAHQAALAIHNSRSYQQASNRAEALKRLHQIGPALVSISGTPESLKTVLIQIAQNAKSVLGADLVDFYEYVQSRDEYILPPVQVGKRYKQLPPPTKVYEDDVVRTIIKGRQPQYFAEVQEEPTLTRPFSVERPDVPPARFVIRENIKSTAAVPLFVGAEVVGLLFANYRTPQSFPQQQQELIELFASQAAMAIRNARLFEQRKALQDIARDITRILDKDLLLQRILERSLGLLGCEIGSIALLNKSTNQLDFQYAIGKERYRSVPFDRGLIGTAASTRKPVRVGDVTRDPRYVTHVEETRSELDVPMLIGEELVGILNAESTRLDAFDEDSEELAIVLAGQAAVALYNADLFQRTQERLGRRLNDLKALQNVYDAIGQDPLEEILRLVAKQAVNLTPAQYGNLWLLEQEQQELRFGVEVNLLDTPSQCPDRIPVDEHSINGWVALTGKSYLCEDVTVDEHYQQIVTSIRSELAVPLSRRERVVGTLNVESTGLAAFAEDHRRLLEALAGQAAIAIDNARLYNRLNVLARVGQAVISTLDLDKVLDNVLGEALEALETSHGTVQLLNRSQGTLEVKARRGEVSGQTYENIRLGEGITGWVALHGESFLARDVQGVTGGGEEMPQYLPYFAGTRCELAVPIQVENRTIGVLNVEHPQPFAFDEQDVHLLEAIARQAAVAIRNARLYEAMQVINEVGQALTKGIRLKEKDVLDLIHNQASRLMDTDNIYIALYDEVTDTVRFGLAFVNGKQVDVEKEAGWRPRRAGKGKTEEIIRTRKPLFHPTKAEAETWYAQPEHKEYVAYATGSWLGVPMMVGERVLGVIAIYHPVREYVYSGDDLETLQTMADQAAIALDNARMFYDVNQRLEALIDFGRVITSGIHLREEDILELIHSQASRLMDTDNMYIALYDEATDVVRFGLAFVGGERVDVEKEEGWQPRKTGQGKTEEIIRTRKPLFHPTKAEAETWYAQPEHEEYVGGALPSWLGVPMMVGERVLGVIAIYHPVRDYVYSGDDLLILQGMANQAAVALENARLYQEAEKLYREARSEAVAARQLATLGTAMAALQHRINNTFNIIVPNVMRLRRRADMADKTIVEILDIIERNARYTSDVIKRIQEPLGAAERQSVDVNAVLTDVVNKVQELWKTDSTQPFVLVELVLDDSIPYIQAPIGQIAEVFRNLVDNAYRAMMAKGGYLTVKSEHIGGSIQIRIQDTGYGIPPEVQKRLFVKPVPSKDLGRGAGLGLWLSRLMLQSIGGDVIMEKTDPGGTTMLVQIPLLEERDR